MQKLNKEKALLEKSVNDYRDLKSRSDDAQVMVEMVKEAEVEAAKAAVIANKLPGSGSAVGVAAATTAANGQCGRCAA